MMDTNKWNKSLIALNGTMTTTTKNVCMLLLLPLSVAALFAEQKEVCNFLGMTIHKRSVIPMFALH